MGSAGFWCLSTSPLAVRSSVVPVKSEARSLLLHNCHRSSFLQSCVMGWYGQLARTKAYFKTLTHHFQSLFFPHTIEIRASDRDTFSFKLTKYPCFHFCLLLALTTTLQEGPQIKLITGISFGRRCFLKTPANLLRPIS